MWPQALATHSATLGKIQLTMPHCHLLTSEPTDLSTHDEYLSPTTATGVGPSFRFAATFGRRGFRPLALAAVVAVASFAVVPRGSAQQVPVAPEAKSFDLGAFKAAVLRDGALEFPNDGKIFATNASPADVEKALKDAGAPTDKIRLDIDALLVQMPGHVVLIDTGYGSPASVLQKSLALAGVSPAQVTDIFITHAHHDHVGGLVDAQGRPAFPKATIRMTAKEWAFMQTEPDLRTEVPAIKAQVKTFEPGDSVVPGITSVDLAGHTPGQSGYEIVSHGHRLLDIGDVAHSSIVSLANPGWTLAWDADKPEATEVRQNELEHLADTRELMFAPHFPFPGVGRIEHAGDGFHFKPDIP